MKSIKDQISSNLEITDLQNQICDLKNHESVNKIHDDILASIKFELQNIVASQASSHAQFKQSINVSAEIDTPTAVKSSPCIFPGKHYDSHRSNFLQQDYKVALESFVAIND